MGCRWREIGAKLTENSRNGLGLNWEWRERWTILFGCGEEVNFSLNARTVPIRGREKLEKERKSRQILFAGKVEEEVDDSQERLSLSLSLGVFP